MKLKTLFSITCCFIALTAFSAEPRLRFGVMSDSQASADKNSWGIKNARKALELFRHFGAEAIVFNGDLMEQGNNVVYTNFLEHFHEVYPEKAPELIVTMGNHEYLPTSQTPEERRTAFKAAFGYLNRHIVLNGYHFISICPDNIGASSSYLSSVDFAQAALKEADAASYGKPIFVVTHNPLPHTLTTVDFWGASPTLEKLLENAPASVIHFSGHTHYPIQDEREIYQGKFTSVGSSSLCYASLDNESGTYNGKLPQQWLCNQVLFVEVYDDHLDIIRIQLGETPELSYEIKPEHRWRLPIPITPDTFKYTNARKDKAVAPQFGLGSKAEIIFSKDDEKAPVKITFPTAFHRDFVHTYFITVDGDDGSSFVLRYPTDFYLGLDSMATQYTFAIPADQLCQGVTYTATVVPAESFGKKGLSITTAPFKYLNP